MDETPIPHEAETLSVYESFAPLSLEAGASTTPPLLPAAAPVPVMGGALALYRDQVRGLPPLSAAERADLLERMRRGDPSAQDALVLSHLGLVIDVVEERRRPGADLLDLLEVGNHALAAALKAFDVAVGAAADFETFLRLCIRSAVDRAVCA